MNARAVPLLAAALSLGVGIGVGLRLSSQIDPATRAAAPAPLAALPVGPDFSTIARRATPAVVNISALSVGEPPGRG